MWGPGTAQTSGSRKLYYQKDKQGSPQKTSYQVKPNLEGRLRIWFPVSKWAPDAALHSWPEQTSHRALVYEVQRPLLGAPNDGCSY